AHSHVRINPGLGTASFDPGFQGKTGCRQGGHSQFDGLAMQGASKGWVRPALTKYYFLVRAETSQRFNDFGDSMADLVELERWWRPEFEFEKNRTAARSNHARIAGQSRGSITRFWYALASRECGEPGEQ